MSCKNITILWKDCENEGIIELNKGAIVSCCTKNKDAKVVLKDGKMAFSFLSKGSFDLDISNANTDEGAGATIVFVKTINNPFCFFLRDVNKHYPIYIPKYGVIVTEKGDMRTFKEIRESISGKGLMKGLQLISIEPEESFKNAAANTRKLFCETWLGVSRDIRTFSMDFEREDGDRWNWIQPRYHGYKVTIPESENVPVRYDYMIGRGIGSSRELKRYLNEGSLPILHADIKDNDILYSCKAFAGFEVNKLKIENIRGTHYLVADENSVGRMFTEEQEDLMEKKLCDEMNRNEETVLYFQSKAINTAAVPRYAWFKNIIPNKLSDDAPVKKIEYSFKGDAGFSSYESGRVFCIAKLNGKPLPQEEIAILLNPGEIAIFEFYIPHIPISEARARLLSKKEFDVCFKECKAFWKKKLDKAAKIELPEKRIEQMLKAGLLHTDIIAYGLEPEGAITATTGVYSAIGSESWPIIHFMDSMGWHKLARRAIMYFIEKQHDNGLMQNFGGYMVETGAILWSIGEHFRYTQDYNWLESIADKIIKACGFIIKWRDRNKLEALRGKGYGMLEGKMADCNDYEMRIFMLNGFAYLGLKRISEVLRGIRPEFSSQLSNEVKDFKNDIRKALFDALGKGMAVPLGDGTWCPTIGPWANQEGPVCLFAKEGMWYTHGNFTTRDSHLPWLIFQEVIEANEEVADFILNYYNEHFFAKNVRFSQPYYSRHPFVHLKRDEVKPFLKAYYNGFSGLADRETYTFWEHYYHASPHKTHEEACFLMESRWMLYMEEGSTLKLLRGIPRRWLKNDKKIKLDGVVSYFGRIFFELESKTEEGLVKINLKIQDKSEGRCYEKEYSGNTLKYVDIRVPHPLGQIPIHVEGGEYIEEKETVRIINFKDSIEINIRY